MAKKKMNIKGKTKPPRSRPSSDTGSGLSKMDRDASGLFFRGSSRSLIGYGKTKVKLKSVKRKK